MTTGIEKGAKMGRDLGGSTNGYDGHVASVMAERSTDLTLLNPHKSARRYPLSQLQIRKLRLEESK